MTAQHVQCRYLRRSGEQCTGEVLDPEAEVLVCAKHAGRVMEMVKRTMAQAKKTGARTSARKASR